jgi:hypothetical protein
MRLDELTAATFEPHIGSAFAIGDAPAQIELVLESVTRLGDRPGGREPFSLLFHGPPQPVLAQAIQRLEHPSLGVLEIFVVPLAPVGGASRYEAIFT